MNISVQGEKRRLAAVSPDWEPWGVQPLDEVPSPDEAPALAALTLRAAGQGSDAPVDLDAICALAGARARIGQLGGCRGRQEAMLTPLPRNRFGICVDPTPRGGWRTVPAHLRVELKRHRFRFRVGHELPHAFFYSRRGDTPRRHLFDSTAQEEFCDAFSRELLVPRRMAESADPTPEGVLRVQAACDVSLELAARAVASAQPQLRMALWFTDPERGQLTVQWASEAMKQAVDPSSPATTWIAERQQLLLVE